MNGDDAFGYRLSEKLRPLEGDRTQILFTSTVPENFLSEILEFKPDVVVVFDAADYGGGPGEIRRLTVGQLQSMHFSTHRAPVKMFDSYLRDHGLNVVYVGVQVKQTGVGLELSSEVAGAVEKLFSDLRSQLESR